MRYSLIIVLIAVLSSCSNKKKMEPVEYMKFMNSTDNGVYSERVFTGVSYKAKMQTPLVIALNSGTELSKDKLDSCISYYKNKMNFVFTMEDNGSSKVKKAMFDAEQYGAIMSYANSDLKNDFKLLHGEDTVYCHIVHLEPANSIQPIIRMTIGFSGLDTNLKDITLIYNDNIFRNGPLKFHYSKELLESFPEIKLN